MAPVPVRPFDTVRQTGEPLGPRAPCAPPAATLGCPMTRLQLGGVSRGPRRPRARGSPAACLVAVVQHVLVIDVLAHGDGEGGEGEEDGEVGRVLLGLLEELLGAVTVQRPHDVLRQAARGGVGPTTGADRGPRAVQGNVSSVRKTKCSHNFPVCRRSACLCRAVVLIADRGRGKAGPRARNPEATPGSRPLIVGRAQARGAATVRAASPARWPTDGRRPPCACGRADPPPNP